MLRLRDLGLETKALALRVEGLGLDLGLKVVLQRIFILFQPTNDLCTSFTKIVIISFLNKAVFL